MYTLRAVVEAQEQIRLSALSFSSYDSSFFLYESFFPPYEPFFFYDDHLPAYCCLHGSFLRMTFRNHFQQYCSTADFQHLIHPHRSKLNHQIHNHVLFESCEYDAPFVFY
jgi:hypothetical protein